MSFTKITAAGIDTSGTVTTQSISVSGVSTVGSLSIGATSVISSAFQLQNIASLDATTTATIESAISNAPNTFTNLNITGISTFVNGPVLIGSGTSTGTAGQVLQATGGAYVSGNLGIGVTSPSYKLDIDNTGGSTATARVVGNDQANVRLRIQNIGSGGRAYEIVGGLNGANNSHLSVYDATAAATRLTITDTGLLGVGTASPSTTLDVQAASARSKLVSTTGTNAAYHTFLNTGGNFYIGLDNSAGTDFSAAYAGAIWHGGAYPLVFGTSNAERLRITSAGLMGVGTTSPSVKLHVNGARAIINDGTGTQTGLSIGTDSTSTGTNYGAIDLNGSAYAGIHLRTGDTLRASLFQNSGTSTTLETNTSAPLIFGTNSTERLRITSAGLMGLGTTTPQARLDLGLGVSTYIAGTEALLFPSAVWGPSIGTNNRTYLHFTGAGGGSTFAIGIHGYQINNPAATNYFRVAPGIAGNPVTYYRFDSDGFKYFADSSKTTGDADYTPTQRFTIDTSGQVCIGTSSPGSQLQVNTGSAATIGQIIQLASSQTADVLKVVRSDTNNSLQFTPSGQLSFGDISSSPTTVITLGPSTSTNANIKVTANNTGNPNLLLQSMAGGGGGIGGPTSFVYFGDNNRALSYIGGTKTNSSASNASSDLVFGTTPDISTTAVTERARIDSSGRLLVGTSFTQVGAGGSDLLQVTGAINLVSSTNIYSRLLPTGSGLEIIANAYPANLGTTQSIIFKSGTSGGGGPSEIARFTSDGRLLVGTSTARSLFFSGAVAAQTQIEGNSTGTASLSITRNDATADGNALILAKARSTSYAIVQYVNGTTSDDRIGRISFQGADGTNMVPAASIESFVDGTPGSNDMPGRLIFSTTADGSASPTERMRITSAGHLLVGTTAAGGRLAVASANATVSPIATTSVTGDTVYQAILVTKFDNDTTTSQNFIQFQVNNGGANCGRITANGANTAAFGSTSDIRLKNNIEDLPPQLQNILSLRPVEFDYIESEGGGHQIGFIAQEMQAVYPDVVNERGEDDMLMITGWSKTEARLVKALQEAVAKIETLEARLTALEGA